MKNYREKLKITNWMLAVAVALLAAVQILAWLRVIKPVAGDSYWMDRWNGFIAGAAFGVMALFLFGLIRNLLALRSEEKLKKQYAKDNDERTIEIARLAQSAGVQIGLIGMLVAVVVSGYFSMTVSLTCLVCVFAQSVIVGLAKLYYHRKL